MQLATKLLSFTTKQKLQQEQWPLKDDKNKELILPSDLYWNYVYPYTAVDDRIIINKHTKTTQFYADHRAKIDTAFLDKHKGANNISMCYMKWLIGCILESKTLSNKDHELLLKCTRKNWLDTLLHVRRCWDISLSRVISPSIRFSKCLSLFCGPLFEELEDIPLLFCGKGRVEDVIKFHTLMDKNSINGPLVTVDGDFPSIFPKTIIGFWLDRYLKSAFNDMIEAGDPYSIGYGQPIYTAQLEHIVRALLEVKNIDISPFFESLDSCSETFYAYDVFKPGMSIVDCMKRYSKWWLNEYESPIGPGPV